MDFFLFNMRVYVRVNASTVKLVGTHGWLEGEAKNEQRKGLERLSFFMINMIKLTCSLSPAASVVFALLSIHVYIPSSLRRA